MRAERSLALSLLVASLAFATGCRKPAAPSCARSETTVACVDGAPVARTYVEQFAHVPWWNPGSSVLPDARKEALDRAVRTLLFASEAKRRGLKLQPGAPDAFASWAQALVLDESTKHGLTREAISDAEAAQHYEANKEMFNQVDDADVQVIAFDDPKLAEQVYAEAVKTDTEGFKALVAKHSVDAATKAKGGDRKVVAGTDEDRAMLTMVLTIRKPGIVGGPFKAADGRWYLLRIKTSPVEHAKPLDDLLRTTVKNAMVDQRRRKVLDALEVQLRAKAKIEIFDDVLAKVALPSSE